ncbi:hypothetical protein MXB_59 [Myxobolus squamalis]|nr:hypothetical protein MXB_59 [Myxobolus squamalis]
MDELSISETDILDSEYLSEGATSAIFRIKDKPYLIRVSKIRLNKSEDQPSVLQLCDKKNHTQSVFAARDVGTWAVEIKPKWCHMTFDDAPSAHHFQNDYCRFCIQRLSRAKSNLYDIHLDNKYCPVDIYSCCHFRIHRAVVNLFEFPQNNLKISKNGIRQNIVSLDPQLKNNLISAVLDIIFDDAQQNRKFYDSASNVAKLCKTAQLSDCCKNFTCNERARGGIFDILSRFQCADKFGIYAITKFWNAFTKDEKKKTFENLADYFSSSWRQPIFSTPETEFHSLDSQNIIRNFLISLVFRDVSIIFTFQINDSPKPGFILPSLYSRCDYKAYQIKLIDLDPRSPFDIPLYCEFSNKIYHSFLKAEKLPPCDGSCNLLSLSGCDSKKLSY